MAHCMGGETKKGITLNDTNYSKAVAAYRKGFLIGALVGIVGCLILGKAIFSLPLLLGLLFGAIGFDKTLTQ